MKKYSKFITITLFFIAGSINGFGQEYKDFDLSTYKLPDIVRNELDFSLSSSGEFNDRNATNTDAFNIDGNLKTAFNRYKNTTAFRGWHNAELGLGGKYSSSGESKKYNDYNVSLYYNNTSKFYNDKQVYFGTGGSFYFSVEGVKNQNEEYKYKDKRTDVRVHVPLVVGKGRIEEVKDARQAVYILDNLAKRGVLKRKLSNQEVYELAQIISTIKNKRFLDSRLRMIDEITTVDSFFVKNNLLSTVGAPYFTTLYDYWMYGDRFSRGSGMEIESGIRPGFDYLYRKGNEKAVVPAISADFRLTYEKPVNLYWQRSAFVSLSGLYQYNKLEYPTIAMTDNNDQYTVSLNGQYKWGYYPTSRTNINFGINEYAYWQKNKPREDYSESTSQFTSITQAFAELYYYFSPQLRLSVNAGLLFNYNRLIENGKNDFLLKGRFMATLTYSLF